MNFSRKSSQDDIRIDLTSLIDVVFLLIIFFMVTTTFQARSGISVKLPEAESRLETEEVNRLVVSISADGSMFLTNKKVDENSLGEELAGVAKANRKTLLVIRADKSVPHGKVVMVMDSARSAGLTNIAIATVRKKAP